MGLSCYLAMTEAEIRSNSAFPHHLAFMACHFSPYTQGLSNLPAYLPQDAMLILNDRMPCCGHSADLVAGQLRDIVAQHGCESLLLDFQRPPDAESENMVRRITDTLPCPVAATEAFAKELSCPVFLSPAPLHIPLSEYLEPWRGREIWLEAALEQADITVTENGTECARQFPPDGLTEGFYDEILCCNFITRHTPDRITFTLFDTAESLQKKLDLAQSLGVSRAVGLWQELGTFPTGK